MPSARIVSLLPSATEIVCALGLESSLVGRSHECDFPPSVANLPVCSQPNIAVDGSSAAIDRLVSERAAQALSIYDLDSDLLARLQPSHILTQTQCAVCAVSLADVEHALGRQSKVAAACVVSLEPHTIADVWRDIGQVARSCGVPDAGESLVRSLQARMEAIEQRALNASDHPAVAAIEWLDPLMTAGNWIPELVEKAGGHSILGDNGKHSPYIQWSQIVEADPDVIVLFPCGLNIARTRREMNCLTERPEWRSLNAVSQGRVYLCDGNQYLNRPGPRLVESLQALAEILHPPLFHPALEGIAWERFE